MFRLGSKLSDLDLEAECLTCYDLITVMCKLDWPRLSKHSFTAIQFILFIVADSDVCVCACSASIDMANCCLCSVNGCINKEHHSSQVSIHPFIRSFMHPTIHPSIHSLVRTNKTQVETVNGHRFARASSANSVLPYRIQADRPSSGQAADSQAQRLI